MNDTDKDVVIELKNAWKIFGARAEEAMKAVKSEGIGKAEVLEQIGRAHV